MNIETKNLKVELLFCRSIRNSQSCTSHRPIDFRTCWRSVTFDLQKVKKIINNL
ncbi:hypothetical protein LguiA_029385 [Lonicera macranthoides]